MKQYLSLFGLLWLLSACTPNSHVEFDPKQGDRVDYWVQTKANIDIGGRVFTQYSNFLMHYEVIETSPTLKLELVPKFMTMSGGGNSFSSFTAANDEPELQQMFSSGFEITLDKDSGKLLAFKGKDEESWQKMLARSGPELIEHLTQGMETPGVLQKIPAKEGSKLILEGFNGQQTELLVTKVTPEIVDAELTAESGDSRLYGHMRLARESGWLQKMVLVLESKIDAMGQQGNNHIQIVMSRKDLLDQVGDLRQQIAFDDMDNWNPIMASPPKPADGLELSAESLFQYGKGTFRGESEHLQLELLLTEVDREVLGEIRYRDLQALDAEDKPIAMEWSILSQLGPYRESGALITSTAIVPLGWDQRNQFEKISSFSAVADYTPLELVSVSSQWRSGQEQQLALAGGTLTITPVAQQEGEYLLHFSGADGYLVPFFDGLEGEFRYQTPQGGPEWLNSMDRSLLFSSQQLFRVKLTKPAAEVTFHAILDQQQAGFSREVRWVSREAFAADYTLPPMGKHYLYYNDTDEEAVDFDPASFATQADTPQGAKLILPQDWAGICQLQIEGDFKQGPSALVWKAKPNERMTTQVEYQLSTEDGIRRYFYGLEIPSHLHCDGRPVWNSVDYTPGERAWLVPLEVFGELDRQQSVQQFLQNYHLYSADDVQLPLLDKQARYLSSEDIPLSEAIMEDKYLRVADSVERIGKLDYQGEPLDIRWVNSFPPLP
ncbi:hypothetical protein LZ659_09735 [Shewanella indica]|uniref:hypothetical protein n=1 Tax=Shewanella indica TaxID=768528 RepID=UPI001F41527C|nr:hypothetical protein [Shewanella indica]MCE9791877.1 hypothetical protein [Shewanella indica]